MDPLFDGSGRKGADLSMFLGRTCKKGGPKMTQKSDQKRVKNGSFFGRNRKLGVCVERQLLDQMSRFFRSENYAKRGKFDQNCMVLDPRGSLKSWFWTPFLRGPGPVARVFAKKGGQKMTPFWGTPRRTGFPGGPKISIFDRPILIRNRFVSFFSFLKKMKQSLIDL